MHSNGTTYKCCECGDDIVDHVYYVERRRIRPLKEGKVHNTPDLIDPSHAGVILGPEYDPYCPTCYEALPDIQELIDAYKNRINNAS